MRRLILLIGGLCLAPLAVAESETAPSEALEILAKADAAIKAVAGVRYKGSMKPSGIAVNFFPGGEGEGVMYGWNGSTPEKFYARVTAKMPGSDEPVRMEGGGDGDSYYLIDHKTKKAYEDMDPGVLGSGGQILQNLGMSEYVHDAPFDDELAAETAELQGTEAVGGVECHKIHVVYRGGRGASTWFFSKEDFLPRRRVRHFDGPNGDGAVEITISTLELDPKFDAGLFKLKLPEGYEQIDDFAP